MNIYINPKHFYLCSIIFLLLINFCFAKVGDVIISFDTPDQFPTGLTYDGKYLWLADRKTDMLYQINPKNGKQITSLPAPGFSPTGVTCDGTHLWVIDDKER